VSVAAYERTEDGFTYPPSGVARISVVNGELDDRVDLQGEIVALVEGEGARWALVRDKVVADGPRFRVKRIAGDGTVVSHPVPAGEEPNGQIVAGGGGIWVPVQDGVLRFDLITGAFAGKVPLATGEPHAITVGGKAAYVSDGPAVLRLDPGSETAQPLPAPLATSVLGLASTPRAPLVELRAPDATGRATVTDVLGSGTVVLPPDVDARGLRSANGVLWVEATVDGVLVAVVLDPAVDDVDRVVRLPDTDGATLSFLSRHRAIVVSDGQMWTASLGRRSARATEPAR
jgi:hypothetical protein